MSEKKDTKSKLFKLVKNQDKEKNELLTPKHGSPKDVNKTSNQASKTNTNLKNQDSH